MPAQRPSASFEPIPPNLDLDALVESTPNFQYVTRIPCDMIEHQGLEAFEKLVLLHVIIGGKPLVIDGFQHRLDKWTFTTRWLRDNVGQKCMFLFLYLVETYADHREVEQARNLTKKENMPLSINHYLNNLPLLTDQWNPYNYMEPKRQRIYLKDIDCPSVWHDKLKEQIPPGVFYLNDGTGEVGGPGSVNEPNPHGLGLRKSRGAARAGDLMSCLPPAMRAENMMCYIGHEGTYTPAHREMCASLGQNIMVETSGTVGEDGKPTKPGSSIWFMTETKDRHLVSEYWLSTLGHDIEVESHFAQINAWKAAPFTTYIVEQKVGDFLLIPPLAPHQVWNRGTRTMKAAWNRTTVETLEMALNEALPRARLVCRDEQYKNKAIVLFSLQRYSNILKHVELQKRTASDEQQLLDLIYSPKIRQLKKDFKRLFILYTQILLSEMPLPSSPLEKRVQYLPYDSNITCSYCRCNIFNRFLTCPTCIAPLANGEEDSYDICMECYVMGRSCRCLSKFKWVEQFPWKDLVEKHSLWRTQILSFEDRIVDNMPKSLDNERKRLKYKTLAEICQEQLKLRPWNDPKKQIQEDVEPELEEAPEEDEVNNDGTIKKRPKKRRSEKWLQDNVSCHICIQRSAKWKHAICSCGLAFCYGTLWRGFDMMPQTVMEDPNWKCPRCFKICHCSSCRRSPLNKPFEPKGTILGHDTKKFADPRSVESLVDFSHSNIHFVKKAGDDHPHETRRLRRHQDEAQMEKSRDPALDEHYVDDQGVQMTYNTEADPENNADQHDGIPIDPLLNGLEDHLNYQPHQGSGHDQPVASSLVNGDRPRAPVANMTGHPSDSLPIQRAAQDALHVMGMGDSNPYYQEFSVPNNGISYEYPDPTAPALSPQANGYTNPEPSQFSEEQPQSYDEPCSWPSKRKGKDLPMLRSDLPTLPIPTAVAKTKASGKSKIVKLNTSSSRLAEIEAGTYRQRHTTNSGAPASADPEESVLIISSDLPQNTSNDAATAGKVETKKRKWTKGVLLDDDFSTRKSRKTSTGANPKGRWTSIVNYAERSESDIEDEPDIEPADSTINRSKPTRRSLPGYLARRSPVNTSEMPKELANEPIPKTSQKKKVEVVESVANATSSAELSATVAEVVHPARSAGSSVVQPAPEMDLAHQVAAFADVVDHHVADSVEANRKAKLKAMRWSQGNGDNHGSESDSGESLTDLIPPRGSDAANLPKQKQASATDRPSTAAADTAQMGKKSIFSRPGIGKIRITSAKQSTGAETTKRPVPSMKLGPKH
ncbi:hypothetical protein MMC34_006714 [Xylographa carneopallida]|nr:hypothetical protein [Xylographa carneopallida]